MTASADRRSPLVTVDDLRASLEDPDLVVVDTRWYLGRPGAGRQAYLDGHIPGAIFLDLDDDLADLNGYGAPGRHPLPDPGVVAERLGRAGIGDRSMVVAYDDVGGWVAARLWWMLDDLGFAGPNGVLDGGLRAWTEAGLALERGEVKRSARELRLADHWQRVIDRDELRARLGTVVLLDARAAPRYRGETEPIDPIAGHIPTAVNAPIDGNLGPDGRFLDPASIRARFASLGAAGSGSQETGDATSSAEVVTSCGSGTSALHHALAMRHAGLPDPILYVGSYSDWSRSGYPIATGPEPGPPPDPPPDPQGRAAE